MNKNTSTILLAIILTVILIKIDFFDHLLAFLLAGVIPGGSLSVPSLPMLLLTTGAIWLVLLKFTALKAWHRKITDRLMSLDKAASARRTGHNHST